MRHSFVDTKFPKHCAVTAEIFAHEVHLVTECGPQDRWAICTWENSYLKNLLYQHCQFKNIIQNMEMSQ